MFSGLSKVALALLVGVFLLPSSVSAATFERPLEKGMSGTDVSALQTILKEEGFFNTDITGFYGQVTLQAVADFQRSVGLDHSGYVGPATRALLNGETIATSSVQTGSSVPVTPASPSLLSTLITQLQQLLRNAGYYAVSLTGVLDQATLQAAHSVTSGTSEAPRRSGGRSSSADRDENTVVPDTIAPVISAIASSTATTTAAITWTTDEPASSRVDYGTTTAYGMVSTSTGLSTSHTVLLSGLTASTTYHLQVQSTDATGNMSTSTDRTFTTAAIWVAPDALDYLRFDVAHAPKLFNGPRNVANGTSNFRVVMMGHSIPQAYRSNTGDNSTLQLQYGNATPQSYSVLAAQALGTALGIPFRSSAWFGDASGSTSASTGTTNGSTARYRADPRVSTFSVGTGNWIGQSGTRLGGNRLRNIASTNRIRFTDTAAVDTAEIYYGKVASGGAFNVAVANGTAIGSSTDTTGTEGEVAVQNVALGSLAVQSVDAWRSSGAFDLLGMVTYNSTIKQGIMINAARQGSRISTWNDSNAMAELGLIQPDVVFMQVDLNEWIAGVDPAVFASDYQAWITSVKALSSAPDIIIVVSSTPNPATVYAYPWSSYRDVMYQLAQTNNLPLIDMGAAIDYDYANAIAGGLLNSDGLHWLANFHSHVSNQIANQWAAGVPS